MSTGEVHSLSVEEYELLADEYYQSLPLEHFMEGTAQATQREITLASLALLRGRRPEVHVYNELLVQYFHEGRVRQVVPDNMVILSDQPLASKTSYLTEYDPPPLLVLEWVSPSSKGKDYRDSFHKYEQVLRVPYALSFYPNQQDLRCYRHTGTRYEPIPVNTQGRQLIPELELEIGLHEGWVRYWYRGELLELPAVLQNTIDELKIRVEQAEKLVREQRQQLERVNQLAQEQQQRADLANRLAQEQERRADQAEQQHAALEAEMARLRSLLAAQAGGQPPP